MNQRHTDPAVTSHDTDELVLAPHFHDPQRRSFHAYSPGDDFYEALIDAHRELDDAASERLNARLVLILANRIGSLPVLRQALAAARAGLDRP